MRRSISAGEEDTPKSGRPASVAAGGTGKPFVFHDLRHTFGTLAVQAFALSDVKAYLGHADIQTTMLYVHDVLQHDAADRLGNLIAEASGYPAGIELSESQVAEST